MKVKIDKIFDYIFKNYWGYLAVVSAVSYSTTPYDSTALMIIVFLLLQIRDDIIRAIKGDKEST